MIKLELFEGKSTFHWPILILLERFRWFHALLDQCWKTYIEINTENHTALIVLFCSRGLYNVSFICLIVSLFFLHKPVYLLLGNRRRENVNFHSVIYVHAHGVISHYNSFLLWRFCNKSIVSNEEWVTESLLPSQRYSQTADFLADSTTVSHAIVWSVW